MRKFTILLGLLWLPTVLAAPPKHTMSLINPVFDWGDMPLGTIYWENRLYKNTQVGWTTVPYQDHFNPGDELVFIPVFWNEFDPTDGTHNEMWTLYLEERNPDTGVWACTSCLNADGSTHDTWPSYERMELTWVNFTYMLLPDRCLMENPENPRVTFTLGTPHYGANTEVNNGYIECRLTGENWRWKDGVCQIDNTFHSKSFFVKGQRK